MAISGTESVYALQAGGRRFDPGHVHQLIQRLTANSQFQKIVSVAETVAGDGPFDPLERYPTPNFREYANARMRLLDLLFGQK